MTNLEEMYRARVILKHFKQETEKQLKELNFTIAQERAEQERRLMNTTPWWPLLVLSCSQYWNEKKIQNRQEPTGNRHTAKDKR